MDGGQPQAVPVEEQHQVGNEMYPEDDDALHLGEFPGGFNYNDDMDWAAEDEEDEGGEAAAMDAVEEQAQAERHLRLWNIRGNRALCASTFLYLDIPLSVREGAVTAGDRWLRHVHGSGRERPALRSLNAYPLPSSCRVFQ